MATGKEALEKLAELAAKATTLHVTFPSQNDQAFSLRVSAVHPLQALENVHQDQVRKAISKAKTEKKEKFSPDDEQEAEKEQLAKYFLFTPSEPRLVNLKPEEEEKTIESELAEAAKSLKLVKAVLASNPDDTEEKRDKEKLKTARGTLEDTRKKLVEVRGTFKDDGDKVTWLKDAKKILEDEDGDKKTLQTRIGEVTTWALLKKEYGKLDEALDSLEEAAGGLARITMLYGISPFFLFRLLVQYRIEKKTEIIDKERRDVSEVVTGHLNKQAWVRDWLAKQMNLIDKEISGWEPHVFFHLKGGRALALLLGEEGENDWDTSVVIDPTLPDDQWYALYNQIHDKLLELLRTAKQEFLVLASQKAADFKQSCTDAIEDLDEEEDEEVEEDLDDFAEMQKETAKAEMIDIGIPRRDTVEALEQWHHTKDSILVVTKYDAKIPIPGPLYYVEEYVVMVREALSGRSPSLHKTAKRIQRLANVLDAKNIDATLGEVKKKIPKSLEKSLVLLGKKKGRVGRVMTLLLQEFSAGHRLSELAGLAGAFDAVFAKDGETPTHDKIPEAVTEGKKKYFKEKDGRETTWNDTECDPILEHVAFAQTLAVKLEKHLRTRAEYFGFVQKKGTTDADKRRKKLGELVKALYTGSIFSPENRFQVQLAVVRSHAAYLHADYSESFDEKIGVLDPVTLLELRYYCHKDVTATPMEILDLLAKVPLQTYVNRDDDFSTDDITGLTVKENPQDSKVTGDALYLAWPEEVDFGDGFKYKPMILKLSVRQQWPEVSFIWGYPVLSLKDLIRDYVEAAALAGEFETKYRLRGTADILKEMLTHYA